MKGRLAISAERRSTSLLGHACTLAAWLALGGAAWAQSPTVLSDVFASKGFQAERNYFSPEPFEHFDPVSGNVILTFTDLVLPGNGGRALQFQRVFNNQRTHGIEQVSRWSFGFPGVVMQVIEKAPPPPAFVFSTDPATLLEQMFLFTPDFVTADGAHHRTLYTQRPFANNNATLNAVQSSQFFRYDRAERTLRMPDGTICLYDETGRLIQFWNRLADVAADPPTNTVTLAWASGLLTVTQHLGGTEAPRIVTFPLDGAGRPTGMSYAGRTWQYGYETTQAGVEDITSVTPPLGRPWLFSYAHNLSGITTPHQGQITYTYDTRWIYDPRFPNDPTKGEEIEVPHYRDSAGPGGTAGGRWTLVYGPANTGQAYSPATTILTPSGTQVTYQHGALTTEPGRLMGGGVGLYRRIVGPADGPPVEIEDRSYQAVPSVSVTTSPSWWWGTPEVQTRTLTRDTRAFTTTYTYDLTSPTFGDYHHPAQVTETSNGQTRITTMRYQHLTTAGGPFVVGLPTSEQVQVGVQSFTREWTYDSATGFRTSASPYGVGSTDRYYRTVFAQDSRGNVASVKTATNKTTTFAYTNGQVSETHTPEYIVSRTINDDGTVAAETQGGRTTTYTYDDLSRLRSTQPPGGVSPIVTDYDDINGAWVRTTRDGSAITTTLDGFGRPTGTSNTQGVQTRVSYDAEGRVIREGYPFVAAADERWTEVEYDPVGRVKARTNPDMTFSTRAYGPGTVTSQDENGATTIQTWQAYGHPDDARLTRVVDAAGQAWSYSYNALGRLASVLAPDGTIRTWTYNTKAQLQSESHPESGATTYAYDLAGVLTRKTDANGTVFDYTYDGNDRVRAVTAGNRVTSIGYEPGTDHRQWTSRGYRDYSGGLLGAVDTVFLYDATGRTSGRQDVIDGKTFSSWYEYDANDRVTAIVYPSLTGTERRQIRQEHDSEGRLTGVFDRLVARTYASELTYHPSGAVASYRAGNGLATQLTYDVNRHWIRGLQVGALWLNYDNYDGVGNVQDIMDSRAGMAQHFTYDLLDRLATAAGPYGVITFPYDAHGNRQGVAPTTSTYDRATLRLVEHNGAPLTYDPAGNLMTAPGRAYQYTPDHMLESATVDGTATSYVYDADGWRLKKLQGGVATYYLRGPRGELLTEWTNPGPSGSTRDYVYAGARLLGAVTTATTITAGDVTGTIVVGGGPVSVPITVPGQNGRLFFTATGGQIVTVTLSGTAPFGCTWAVSLVAPGGGTLGSETPCGGTVSTFTRTLPTSGVYTIFVDPVGAQIGTVSVAASFASPTAPLVTVVTPDIGTPGTPINVTGWNLTPATSVRFNVTATTATGSPTTLTATVPPLATSGRIIVTTPSGAAVSPGDFFIPPAPYTASDVAVTGRLSAGVPTTVSLPAPSTVALLVFDRTAGQRFTLTISDRTIALQHMTILQPDGVALWSSGAIYTGAPYLVDTLTAPITGTYTLLVTPDYAYTGNDTITLGDVPRDVEGSIAPGGAAVPLSLLTPGQNARLRFAGLAGQRIALATTSTMTPPTGVTLSAPDGSVVLYSPSYVGNAQIGSVVALPVTGEYSVMVNPFEGYTGSLALSLYDVPPDAIVPISTDNTPATATVTAPFQNAYLAFAGAVGQRITVSTSSSTLPGSCPVSWVLSPSGQSYGWFCATSGMFVDTLTMTISGTHTIKVDPDWLGTGSATFRINTVPPDVTRTITPGGPLVTVTTTVAGQNAALSFEGTAGVRVSLLATEGTFGSGCALRMRMLRPDGGTLVAASCVGTSGFIDAVTLPITGTYTIPLDPQGTAVGSVKVRLFAVIDSTGKIAATGAPITVRLPVPGKNAVRTFVGTVGQRISMQASQGTFVANCDLYVRIAKPDGSSLLGNTCAGVSAFFDLQVLPVGGTYTIALDPQSSAIGNVTLTLYTVPADATAGLVLNSPAATLTTTVPGQNAAPTYAGTAGQVVTVRLSTNTLGSVTVRLLRPDGTPQATTTSSAASFNLTTQTLPSTGAYTIAIDPSGATTGSIGVRVINP